MSNQREQILSCACELYLSEGMEGFSMRKLADRVGVTAPALYRHYEGKEALLLDVVSEAYGMLAAELYQALEAATPLERFRRAGDLYLDFALAQPRMYEVLYAYPEFLGMVELPEETAAHACAIHQFWNDRVRECQEAGLLKTEFTPEEIGTTLWGHAHGLISLYLRGMIEADEEAFRGLVRASTRRAFVGLGTPELAATIREQAGADEAATRAETAGAAAS